MKQVGFILIGLSSFILGIGAFIFLREKSRERNNTLSSLEKAREAKARKREERINDINPVKELDYVAELEKLENIENTIKDGLQEKNK